MSLARKVMATAQFDLSRSLRPSRLVVFGILAFFPPAITAISTADEGVEFAPAIIGITVMMVGALALLLWATPIVHHELESKTWAYIAIRPSGRLSLLLGKYLMSVVWTITVCTIALTLCVAIVGLADPMANLIRLWAVFFALICMAALAYGALFLLIGTVFPRRSMVFAVAYMILVEGIIAFVPAVINQLTMRHHLTALAIRWLDFDFAPDDFADRILGLGEPTWQNMGILILSPIVLLSVTIYLIVNREYITADEN